MSSTSDEPSGGSPERTHEVVIVGAGFGGIAAAIELKRTRDRRRHDPRARPEARGDVVLQQLSGRRLRRAEPPVLLLL